MEDLRAHIARQKVTEDSAGILVEYVIDIGRTELRGLGIKRRLFGSKRTDAGCYRGLCRSLFLLFGHLLQYGGFMRTQLADGQQLLNDNVLRDDGLELVINDVDGIDLCTGVALDDGESECPYLGNFDLLEHRGVFAGHLDGRSTMTQDFVVG